MTNMSIQPLWLTHFIEILLVLEFQLTKFIVGVRFLIRPILDPKFPLMIVGYGLHGYSKDALRLFTQMQKTDTRPNEITFISVLAACSHVGRLDEGRQYFDCMTRNYCLTPSVKHYACMADLHG